MPTARALALLQERLPRSGNGSQLIKRLMPDKIWMTRGRDLCWMHGPVFSVQERPNKVCRQAEARTRISAMNREIFLFNNSVNLLR